MSGSRVLLFGLLVIGVVLYALNPGPTRFNEFMQDEMARRAEEAARQAGGTVAGRMGEGVAGFLADRLGRAAGDAVSTAFERDDYYVASVYRVDLNGRRPGGEVEFLGIANQFFPLKMPEVWADR